MMVWVATVAVFDCGSISILIVHFYLWLEDFWEGASCISDMVLGTAGGNPASFLAGLIGNHSLFVANQRDLEPH